MCGFHNDDIGQFFDTETILQSHNPNFHTERIAVHSALLKEFYLVSQNPRTYMLEFNEFADLANTIHIHVYIYININSFWEIDISTLESK